MFEIALVTVHASLCTLHIENITMHATNSYKLQQLYSCRYLGVTPFSALTLLLVIVNRKGIRPACKKLGVGLLVVTVYSSSCHHHLHHPELQYNPE